MPIGIAALLLARRLVPEMLVTRISAGPVMAAGMAMIVGGVLWATQAPAQGHFWSALAGPFFIAGAGTAFGFVPISIVGLAGVAKQEAGLASGLLNTSQQLGGAIGLAIAATVAATRFKTLPAWKVLAQRSGQRQPHIASRRSPNDTGTRPLQGQA